MPKANSTEYKRAFVEKHYARISVTIPKQREGDVKAHAQRKGKAVNGLINDLLREDMNMTEDQWRAEGGDPSAGY